MSTLFVFGDSYAEDTLGSWTRLLSDSLGFNLKNLARGGSCLEFSYIKLLENIKKIKKGDVVIFVLTSSVRIDLEYTITKQPAFGSAISSVEQFPNPNFVKEYLLNRSTDIVDNKYLLYISFVYMLSTRFSETKFIVIPGFPEESKINFKLDSDNFLFLNSFSLQKISNQEWNWLKLSMKTFERIFNIDLRENHLTVPNLKELATMLEEVIKYWDSTRYNENRFLRKIINKKVKTVDDVYTHYVLTGLINEERFLKLKSNV
jgi:hypothetical protein